MLAVNMLKKVGQALAITTVTLRTSLTKKISYSTNKALLGTITSSEWEAHNTKKEKRNNSVVTRAPCRSKDSLKYQQNFIASLLELI